MQCNIFIAVFRHEPLFPLSPVIEINLEKDFYSPEIPINYINTPASIQFFAIHLVAGIIIALLSSNQY